MMNKHLFAMLIGGILLALAFSLCASAEDIDYTLTDGVLTLHGVSEEFSGALELPTAQMGEVEKIVVDMYALKECEDITAVSLNAKNTVLLESGCFSCCTNLKTVFIAAEEKIIMEGDRSSFPDRDFDGCFAYCTALESADLRTKDITLYGYCFEYCTSLTNFSCSAKTSGVGEGVFDTGYDSYVPWVENQNGYIVVGDTLVIYNGSDENIVVPTPKVRCDAILNRAAVKSVVLPEGTTELDSDFMATMFYEMEKLTSVKLPTTLKRIPHFAFWGCKSLESIELPSEIVLKYKHTANKEISRVAYKTALTIQAIKTLGKEQITDNVLTSVAKTLSTQEKYAMRREAKYVAAWIYDAINRICQ